MSRFSLPATGGVLFFAAAALFPQAPAPVESFLDRVAARLESFNPKSSWTASVTSTQIENDRKWRPEKTIVQTKAVVVTEGRREENVLKVVETVDGKTADITERFLAEQKARREKYRARRAAAEQDKPGAERSSRPRLRMDSFAELLPFSAERRTEFFFDLRETADPAGRRLYLLDVRAKTKDPWNWEGTYTIDAATFTPLRARLKPSETPAFVKEIEVEAEFEVVEGVHFIPKRTRVKVNGGFLFIKRIRLISEEIYSGVAITN
ncbi:MAG: hypothetical protein NTW38_08915 [Candidatus Aminicenantes bacterium]|nr:hypothetical protein [Candidatus Aminicenantes bacterium]